MANTDLETPDTDAPMYCANHPNVETYLRCGRCDKPICARCRVHTPVGYRCFDCANLQSLPTYAISTDYYLKAAAAGFVIAAAAGTLMGLFPAFEFWAALLMGIGVPEGVAIAANQKRGQGLQMVAIAAIAFGFILSRVVMQALPFLITLGGINVPLPTGVNLPYHITQYTILWFAMAVFLAYQRLK